MDEALATVQRIYPVDTAGATSTGIHAEIEQERKAAMPDPEIVKTFRQYARGVQRSTLGAGQEMILRGILGNLFCDNICKRIIVEVRNRLELIRYEVPNEAVSTELRNQWVLNRMAALQASTHFAMLRDGNAAVSMSWAGDRVALHRELWWNGTSGIFVAYDEDDKAKYAIKDWYVYIRGERKKRRVIWFPGEIQRYIMQGNGWEPYRLETDPPGTDPIGWKHADGSDLGIPVVHFANIQIPNDGTGDRDEIVTRESDPDQHYGMSELDGGVLGLQDELNDIQRDVTAAARYAGYQMISATGTTPRIDPETLEEIPIIVEPGAVFQDRNPDARFGTLTPGSLQELERAIKIKLDAASRQTSLPLPVITGNWPSGDALLQFELPLTDKARTIGSSAGPSWSSIAHKMVRMINTFRRAALDEAALITAIFASPERRDVMTRSEIAVKVSPMVSEKERLIILGYTPERADEIIKERTEDAERAAQNAKRANDITGMGPLDNGSNPAAKNGATKPATAS